MSPKSATGEGPRRLHALHPRDLRRGRSVIAGRTRGRGAARFQVRRRRESSGAVSEARALIFVCSSHRAIVASIGHSSPLRAHTQDNPAEAALASVISDYERILKLADPVTAGLDGDREALRRLPGSAAGTELARPRARGHRRERLARSDVSDLSPASALNHQVLSRLVVGSGRAGGVRLRPHRVPERRRLPHARRLPRTHDEHRLARRCRRLAGPARCAARASMRGASRTCGAASRRGSRSRGSSSIACSRSRAGRRTRRRRDSPLLLPFARMPRGHPRGGAGRLSRPGARARA